MKVFRLTHRRARQLYILTLLEIRRVLWDETRHEPVTPIALRGTKGLPLVKYTNFLTLEEFSKFAALMKDLAPYLVIAIKPSNEAGIRNGNWQAIRENLELILNGVPGASPLF